MSAIADPPSAPQTAESTVPPPPAPPPAPPPKKVTISDRLAALQTAATQPGAVTNAAAEITELANRLTAAQATISSQATVIASQTLQIAEFSDELDAIHQKLSAFETALGMSAGAANTADSAAITEHVTSRISDGVLEQNAKLGVPPKDLPAAQTGEQTTLDDLRDEMARTSDPKKRGELATQARKLRENQNN